MTLISSIIQYCSASISHHIYIFRDVVVVFIMQIYSCAIHTDTPMRINVRIYRRVFYLLPRWVSDLWSVVGDTSEMWFLSRITRTSEARRGKRGRVDACLWCALLGKINICTKFDSEESAYMKLCTVHGGIRTTECQSPQQQALREREGFRFNVGIIKYKLYTNSPIGDF